MIDTLVNFLNSNGTWFNDNQGFLALIGLVLTMLGWVVLFRLSLVQQKKHLKNEAKMKLYQEIGELVNNTNEMSYRLGTYFNGGALPFIRMDATQIGVSAGVTTKVKADLDAANIWLEYKKEFFDMYMAWSDTYRKLWVHIETWLNVMPSLEIAKDELFKEFGILSKQISDYNNYLNVFSTSNWSQWPRDEMRAKANEAGKDFTDIAIGYLNDFFDLVHNQLIRKIFRGKKKQRGPRTFLYRPINVKILTKQGLVEKNWIDKKTDVQYMLRLEVSASQKEDLRTKLQLEDPCTVCVKYVYLRSTWLKSKLNLGNNKDRYCELFFDGDLFDVACKKVNWFKVKKLMKRGIKTELNLTKEICCSKLLSLKCAFVEIKEIDGRIFFELYDHDKAKILAVKEKLEQMGCKDFLSETYDDL